MKIEIWRNPTAARYEIRGHFSDYELQTISLTKEEREIIGSNSKYASDTLYRLYILFKNAEQQGIGEEAAIQENGYDERSKPEDRGTSGRPQLRTDTKRIRG